MSEMQQSFGASIRFLLQQHGIHAEELVERMNQVGIQTNKPAISRVMTGKRVPTEEEAEEMSNVLKCPLLFVAYTLLKRFEELKDEAIVLEFYETVDCIRGSEEQSQENAPVINYMLLYQIVKNLYLQCLTYDVSQQVREGFLIKLFHVSGFTVMIQRLRAMYLCFFQSPMLSSKDRAWLAAALLYFISPIDLIPDYLVPCGYIDDTVVVSFVFFKLRSILIPFMSQSTENIAKNDGNELT